MCYSLDRLERHKQKMLSVIKLQLISSAFIAYSTTDTSAPFSAWSSSDASNAFSVSTSTHTTTALSSLTSTAIAVYFTHK